MTPFDPYHVWLGIPPAEQPADHYRLLGIQRFESDVQVIANAQDQRMQYLRSLQIGKRAEHSQKLLNEIAEAAECLLDAIRRADYDRELQAKNALRVAKVIDEASWPIIASQVRIVAVAKSAANVSASWKLRSLVGLIAATVVLAFLVVVLVVVPAFRIAAPAGNGHATNLLTPAAEQAEQELESHRESPAEVASPITPPGAERSEQPTPEVRQPAAPVADTPSAKAPSASTTSLPGSTPGEPREKRPPPQPESADETVNANVASDLSQHPPITPGTVASDRTRAALEAAREIVQRDVARAQASLVDELKLKEASAAKAKNEKLLESVRRELQALQSRGELPSVVPAKSYWGAVRRANLKLKDAYALAMRQYSQVEQPEQAEAVKRELHNIMARGAIGKWMASSQLLINPGGEVEGIVGRVAGWHTISGEWKTAQGASHEGKYFFASGAVPQAELVQDVNLRELQSLLTPLELKFNFLGFTKSYAQNPADAARVIVECRDKSNQHVLALSDSGEVSNVRHWQAINLSRNIPTGTHWLRVRLLTKRYGSGTRNNDAWFDSLSLHAAIDAR